MVFNLRKISRKKVAKTPTIIQMEATECGAATLTMVLAHYHYFISREEARAACGVSRDGSKTVNILRAARSYGCTAQAAQVEDINVLPEIGFPLIAYWGFNHFVVVEGASPYKKNFYINDPAVGRRVITEEEFSAYFTGIILVIRPGKGFQPQGTPSFSPDFLMPILKETQYIWLSIILASFLLIVPRTLIPGFSIIFIDHILIQQANSWFLPVAATFFSLIGIHGILIWLQRSVLLKVQMKLILNVVLDLFGHLLRLPLSFFYQRHVGDIIERILASDRIASMLTGELASCLADLFTMGLFALILMVLNPKLAILTITLTMINFLILVYAGRRIANLSHEFLVLKSKLMGLEINAINFVENIKSTGNEDNFFKTWANQHAQLINNQQRLMTTTQILTIAPKSLSALTSLMVLAVGSLDIMNGHMSIGTLFAFQGILVAFQLPLSTLSGAYEKFQTIQADIDRLQDVFESKQDKRLSFGENAEDNGNVFKVPNQVSVTLKNLSFGYSPLESPLIKEVSLHIEQGQFVAIVGTNGSGKSTIAKLISGLYQPWSGQVFINQHPLNHYTPENLTKLIGYVDQDNYLFEGTVRENLTLWMQNIDSEILVQALKDACIFDEISQRGGLSCSVEEKGQNFSGGQCQRLEIARALVCHPSLLILDEATSGLDYETERKIFSNLKKRACTLILISHRLNTLQEADNIIVVKQGSVVQQGNFRDLTQNKGIYSDLLQALEGENDE